MKSVKTHLWSRIGFAVLLLAAVAAWCSPGYRFSGLFLFALALLIPCFHLLHRLQRARPRPWKGVTRVLTVSLCALLAAMAVTGGFLVHSGRGSAGNGQSYLVVLGAGVNGRVPSRSLRERLDAALSYLTEHPDTVAVVSGGQGPNEEVSEAACMFTYLTEHGIEPQRVWIEDQAGNTVENLRFSADLIEARTGTRPTQIAIVSSEYHLHRAKLFAGKLGLEADLIPAKTEVLPLRLNYYLREIFAVWYYSIFGGSYYA